MPIDEIPLEVDGEFCLYGAVIKGAMRDWLFYRNSRSLGDQQIAEDARRWLFAPSSERNAFSVFCDAMNIDVEFMRETIRRKAVLLGFGGTDGVT